MTKIVIADINTPIRADKFLASQYLNISRMQIKKSFDNNQILCNGEVIKPKYLLKNGDILEFDKIYCPEITAIPYHIPLEILYEDEHIIVINKPMGIVVHAGHGTISPTLVEGILAHCNLSKLGGTIRPGIVHRLDKDTTGAILFAKTDEAYLQLIKLFAAHKINKQYLAIACGSLDIFSGTINKPIGRHKTIKTKMCIRSDGRSALTDWVVLKIFKKKFSLLSINIHTGRTHQIRVHLSSIGHPILGDFTYGYNRNFDDQIYFEYPLLHAQTLQFNHPITKQLTTISAPLSSYFQSALWKLSMYNELT